MRKRGVSQLVSVDHSRCSSYCAELAEQRTPRDPATALLSQETQTNAKAGLNLH
jgi:hypothetical protein